MDNQKLTVSKYIILGMIVAVILYFYGCRSASDLPLIANLPSQQDSSVKYITTVVDENGKIPDVIFPSGASFVSDEDTLKEDIEVTISETRTSNLGLNPIGTPQYIYLYTISAFQKSTNPLIADTPVNSLKKPIYVTLPKNYYLGNTGIGYVGIRESENDPWKYKMVSAYDIIPLNIASSRASSEILPEKNYFSLNKMGVQFALFANNKDENIENDIRIANITATSTSPISVKNGVYTDNLTMNLKMEGANLDKLDSSKLEVKITFKNQNDNIDNINVDGKVYQITTTDIKDVLGIYTSSFNISGIFFEYQNSREALLSFKINTKGLKERDFQSDFLIEIEGKVSNSAVNIFGESQFFSFETVESDTESTNDTEADTIENTDSDSESNTDTEINITSNTESNTDTDLNTTSDTESNIDSDIESNTDTNINTNIVSDLETNINTDINVENLTVYSIEYLLDGGNMVGDNPISYDVTSSTIILNNPTRMGYTFTGWTGTGLNSASMTLSIPQGSTGNRTYTANWAQTLLTLTIPDSSVQIKLRCCPPGTYMMGSSDNEIGRNENETQHQVTILKPFYIGIYEVTQAQYKAVMDNANPSYWKNDSLPVEQVSWYDADYFCSVLQSKFSSSSLPEGYHFDLPTEAQWEYACRAKTITSLNSDKNITTAEDAACSNVEEIAWYKYNSIEQTHAVGNRFANAWGLYDMHGNVNEWCKDWYDIYPTSAVTSPTGPISGSQRINRGGSWSDYPSLCRSGSRSSNIPSFTGNNTGFRLALVPIE